MSTVPKKLLTEAEYLAIERTADFKSEFYKGEMFAMAGASHQHNEIKDNLVGELCNRLKPHGCRTYSSDQKLKVERTGLYTYPDVIIVCGRPQFDPEASDVLLNPQVILEVLSESTESYDRGKKFPHYQRLPSLKEYVVVSQERVSLERFVRQSDETWTLTVFDDPAGEFALATVPVRIPMADVYRGVEPLEPPLS
jgi:Uma2 family endonuclease